MKFNYIYKAQFLKSLTMISALLILASMQGVFLSIALIVKKAKNRASNIYLSLILILISLQLFFSWGGQTGLNNQIDVFPYWIFLSDLIIPPSLWFFLKHNSDGNFKFKLAHLWFFCPAAVEVLVNFFYRYTTSAGIYSFLNTMVRTKVWNFSTEELPLFATIFVLVVYSKKIIKLRKQFNGLSNPALRIHSFKIYFIFVLFCTLVLMWAALILFNIQLFHLIEIACTITLFIMGYTAYLRPAFFELPKLLYAKTSESGAFQNQDDESNFLRVRQLFEEGNLFSRSKLTLKELSDELKLSPKYVSYLINTYSCSNFNDFVNAYRVKDVLKRIPTERNKNLLGIAMDAGFNSKSTFNQAFKQHTGKSPSEFLHKQ